LFDCEVIVKLTMRFDEHIVLRLEIT
jgi:hypothetical protein